MSRLTRDGTAEPVSGEPILIFMLPVQLTASRIVNFTRLIHTLLYVMTIHFIHFLETHAVQVFARACTLYSSIALALLIVG